jgi:hypothetical protein
VADEKGDTFEDIRSRMDTAHTSKDILLGEVQVLEQGTGPCLRRSRCLLGQLMDPKDQMVHIGREAVMAPKDRFQMAGHPVGFHLAVVAC